MRMSSIFSALRDNDLFRLQKLLDEGKNVNKRDPDDDKKTILLKACERRNTEAVKLILKYKPNINKKDTWGQTPLHKACINGDIDCAVLLLHHQKAKVNAGDNLNLTPLYLATRNNHLGVIKLLLGNGANPNIVTPSKWSPLHVARSYEAVTLLVKFGSNIHATNNLNDTPLTELSRCGHTSAVQSLCEVGAQVSHRGDLGRTALHWATALGRVSTVKYLLTQQPDVSIRDNYNRTALDTAQNKGYKHIEDLITTYIGSKANTKG